MYALMFVNYQTFLPHYVNKIRKKTCPFGGIVLPLHSHLQKRHRLTALERVFDSLRDEWRWGFQHAEIAQLVEHNLAKVGVAGPSPVFRSSLKYCNTGRRKASR